MSVERADKVVTVPERAANENWTADQAQEWARKEVLAGGPPAAPEDPSTGTTIKWNRIREWAGRRVRIRAQPMGLIIANPDGSKRFYPGDATTGTGSGGFSIGTSTKQMREQASVEASLRKFAQAEIQRYNKGITGRIREEERRVATREFWQAGKRIRDFIESSPKVVQDQVWYSLEQWGRGEGGYGKNWLEYATYFHDWKPDIPRDARIFTLSETRVMNILRASKDPEKRNRLLVACLDGPFIDFSDEDFKWITGQSKGTFPLNPKIFEEFTFLGEKVALGKLLSVTDIDRIREIRTMLARAPRKILASQEEPTTEE